MDDLYGTAHVLERNGCALHYWLTGLVNRPLVVLTHGATVDHAMFQSQMTAVTAEYRVLTWDMRGHGLSQPMGQPFTIPLAVDDLLAILDRQGCQQAIFVGQSAGSYVGQELVFRHPERVAVMVVIDGTCITFRPSAVERLALGITPLILELWPYEGYKRTAAKTVSAKPGVVAYCYAASNQIGKAGMVQIMTSVARCIHDEPGYQMTQPLLLVHGADDRTGNIRKIAPVWAVREPHCRYVIIPDAGHMANMDNPGFFNPLLLQFLQEHSVVAPA